MSDFDSLLRSMYASNETHLARLGTIFLTQIGRTEENHHAGKTTP
jgi:hypothetical protein